MVSMEKCLLVHLAVLLRAHGHFSRCQCQLLHQRGADCLTEVSDVLVVAGIALWVQSFPLLPQERELNDVVGIQSAAWNSATV